MGSDIRNGGAFPVQAFMFSALPSYSDSKFTVSVATRALHFVGAFTSTSSLMLLPQFEFEKNRLGVGYQVQHSYSEHVEALFFRRFEQPGVITDERFPARMTITPDQGGGKLQGVGGA